MVTHNMSPPRAVVLWLVFAVILHISTCFVVGSSSAHVSTLQRPDAGAFRVVRSVREGGLLGNPSGSGSSSHGGGLALDGAFHEPISNQQPPAPIPADVGRPMHIPSAAQIVDQKLQAINFSVLQHLADGGGLPGEQPQHGAPPPKKEVAGLVGWGASQQYLWRHLRSTALGPVQLLKSQSPSSSGSSSSSDAQRSDPAAAAHADSGTQHLEYTQQDGTTRAALLHNVAELKQGHRHLKAAVELTDRLVLRLDAAADTFFPNPASAPLHETAAAARSSSSRQARDVGSSGSSGAPMDAASISKDVEAWAQGVADVLQRDLPKSFTQVGGHQP